MKNQDFNCSIAAKVTATEAVHAIGQVWVWWAKDFEGSAEKLNDVFSVRFGETWVNFKITEMMTDNKIVWTVTGCWLPWLQNKTEWTATKVIFEISSAADTTIINFTHQGLQPEVECYDNCVKGWTKYIPGSLLNLLTLGVAEPA